MMTYSGKLLFVVPQFNKIIILDFSMGSVLAATSPNPPASGTGSSQGGPGLTVPPGFTMPTVSSLGTGAQAGTDAEPSVPNPGTFEECHRKCKGTKATHTFTSV